MKIKRTLGDSLCIVAVIGVAALSILLLGLAVAFGGGDEIGSTEPLDW